MKRLLLFAVLLLSLPRVAFAANAVACGNGPCVVHPPVAIQQTVIFAATASVTGTLTQTAGTGADHVIICLAADVNHTTVTPTGYTQLGQQLSSGSLQQITVYYRSPPTGNSSDNCVFSDGSASAKSLMMFELVNAGTPAGFAGSGPASANTLTTSGVAALASDMLIAVFVPNGAIGPTNASPGWAPATLLSGATSSVMTTLVYPAPLAATYTASANLAAAVVQAICIFRVPSYGF